MKEFKQDPTARDPRYEGSEPFTGEAIADGGFDVSEDYSIDEPNDAWYNDVVGEKEIDEVKQVFEMAGVDQKAVYDEGFVPQEAAFSADEVYAIEEAVGKVYDERDDFVDDVADSVVNPFQSKQIEIAFESSVHMPTGFSDYDGFPDRYESRQPDPDVDIAKPVRTDGGDAGFPDYVGGSIDEPDEVSEKGVAMSDFPY